MVSRKRQIALISIGLILAFLIIFIMNVVQRHYYVWQAKHLKENYENCVEIINSNPHLFNDFERVQIFETVSWVCMAERGEIKKVGHLSFIINNAEKEWFRFQNKFAHKKDIYNELQTEKIKILSTEDYRNLYNEALSKDKMWLRGMLCTYVEDCDTGFCYYDYSVRRYMLENDKLYPCSYEDDFLRKHKIMEDE